MSSSRANWDPAQLQPSSRFFYISTLKRNWASDDTRLLYRKVLWPEARFHTANSTNMIRANTEITMEYIEHTVLKPSAEFSGAIGFLAPIQTPPRMTPDFKTRITLNLNNLKILASSDRVREIETSLPQSKFGGYTRTTSYSRHTNNHTLALTLLQ